MKRVSISTLLCCLIIFSAQQAYSQTTALVSQAAIDAVNKQQQTVVTALIKHCKERLPLVTDPTVAHTKTFAALDNLSTFMYQHPDALECVIDTFQACIDDACTDVPLRVSACIQNYEGSEKAVTLADTQALQEKVNNLVVSYFKFQLTLLGALDYYGQEFLYRTQLMTYIELARPWVFAGGVYFAIQYAVQLLEDLMSKNGVKNETAKNFLKEIDTTLFKAIVAGIFSPDIRTSAHKINKYLGENWSKSYAEIISKYRKSGYPAKPSKESFDTIKGYENTKLLMNPVMDFCINLTEYRAADLKMARGYLFEGPLADGRKMAFAVAGEMTKKLEALGSPVKWLTYEIHGSSLVNRKLDIVLEECLEYGPTVLIISNIDWIYTQDNVEPEVYADIINRLARYLSQESNFPLLICATSQDHTIIDPVMLEFHKFELVTLS